VRDDLLVVAASERRQRPGEGARGPSRGAESGLGECGEHGSGREKGRWAQAFKPSSAPVASAPGRLRPKNSHAYTSAPQPHRSSTSTATEPASVGMNGGIWTLSKVFTPLYAARVNAQLVFPASSIIVKPNELSSALSRPLHVATYEPERGPAYLVATLAFGLIKGTNNIDHSDLVPNVSFLCAGHPFLDGNKRTGERHPLCLPTCVHVLLAAFFLADQLYKSLGEVGIVNTGRSPMDPVTAAELVLSMTSDQVDMATFATRIQAAARETTSA
jgi:hypothetical protein